MFLHPHALIGATTMTAPHRRQFLQQSAAAGASLGVLGLPALAKPLGANERLRVGIMGLSRGLDLAKMFAKLPNVEVACVCDVDQKRVAKAIDTLTKAGHKPPEGVGDFRRILDNQDIPILVNAACNHWHAPGAILGCAAGKHVYVEKPCSHTPQEGELLVAATRKAQKQVQMGNQRRSWPRIIEAIERIQKGEIGRPYLAQCWYTNNRPSIGHGQSGPVPSGVDYDLWQGPAPRRPFRSNYLHYNWHWFWHWGNGELGNNGIHMIDVCRWGLGVDFPVAVTSTGGRYRFEDDQETPDTHLVSFTFEGRRTITWQGTSCNRLPEEKQADVLFLGEKGSLAIKGGNYAIYDAKGKLISKETGSAEESVHLANFIAAVRGETKLNSEITEGHKSTLLCHLGNIAHRTGRSLKCDPKDGRILDDAEAMKFWQKEYEKGWEPKV
jgi:predicted dehydrogenase